MRIPTATASDAATAAADDGSGPFLSIGIDGHYRVGRWTGVRVGNAGPNDGQRSVNRETQSPNKNENSSTIVQTRDGDGVRVEFSNRQTNRGRSDWVYVLPGSQSAPLTVMRDGKVLGKSRLAPAGSPSRGPAMLSPEMPWTIVFGDPLGLESVGKNDLLGRDAKVAVTIAETTEDLPDASIGYDAVDMILVTGSGARALSALTSAQAQAIVDWVRDGGRILFTLGQSAPRLLTSAPWVADLLPFDPGKIVTINPSAIETFTSTQTPLDTFQGVKLPRDQGRVLVMGRTTARTITPIASQYNVGLGTVVVVAADLESETLSKWPERLDFVIAMAGPDVLPRDPVGKIQSRRTAYNDLAGQLRVTLDQFAIRRGAGFSLIALVLMGVIAAIGPLDYLLINRLLGRPLLGWISFPVSVVAVSVLLVWQSTRVPSSIAASVTASVTATGSDRSGTAARVQCNRLEIVDIDAVNSPGVGRGQSLGFVYSHDAGLLDVHSRLATDLRSMVTDVQSVAGPFGYPGESFGGIQIAVEDTRLPAYGATSLLDDRPDRPILAGVPLAPRSSKGFFHRFRFRTQVGGQTAVQRRRGSELLQGPLANPLPLDVLDGMLIFRNWVYLLPTRFRAGEIIPAVAELRQKNFRWLLSRQQAIESSSENEAWDPAAVNRLDRLAEMLMFHQVAGGTAYTGLGDTPLAHLDLSQTLLEDRCVLVGRVERPLTDLQLVPPRQAIAKRAGDASAGEPITPNGRTLSILRVVLPVRSKRSS